MHINENTKVAGTNSNTLHKVMPRWKKNAAKLEAMLLESMGAPAKNRYCNTFVPPATHYIIVDAIEEGQPGQSRDKFDTLPHEDAPELHHGALRRDASVAGLWGVRGEGRLGADAAVLEVHQPGARSSSSTRRSCRRPRRGRRRTTCSRRSAARRPRVRAAETATSWLGGRCGGRAWAVATKSPVGSRARPTRTRSG